MHKLFFFVLIGVFALSTSASLYAREVPPPSDESDLIDDELDIEFMDEIVLVEEKKSPLNYSGFLDARYGTRFKQTDLFDNQATLAEFRLQSKVKFETQGVKFILKADLLHDAVLDESKVDWREAYVELPSSEFAQIRVGRQNILWGLGDLLVVNDLFPKDYSGLYSGRDAEAEYMVKPSDAIRTSFFIADSALDIVFSRFEPSDIPHGEKLSYYNPFLGTVVGEDNPLNIKENSSNVWMIRWNKQLFNQEIAFYHNRSYWQTPEGIDLHTGQAYHPELNTYGASSRGELGVGIYSAELAYFDSVEDADGDNYLVRNSEYRYILAYEFELAADLNMSMQWYHETHLQYAQYLASLPEGMLAKDEHYNLLTLRLNQMLLSQKMTLSFFAFYSPSQNDSYVRLNMFHKFDDQWTVNVGANIFNGPQTAQFGQLKENSNYFASIRYSF